MSRCRHDMLASLGVIWASPHLGRENCNTWGNMTTWSIYFCRVLSKDLTTTSDFHVTSLGALCFSSLSHAFSHMTNHPCKFKVDGKFDSLVTISLFHYSCWFPQKVEATSQQHPTVPPVDLHHPLSSNVHRGWAVDLASSIPGEIYASKAWRNVVDAGWKLSERNSFRKSVVRYVEPRQRTPIRRGNWNSEIPASTSQQKTLVNLLEGPKQIMTFAFYKASSTSHNTCVIRICSNNLWKYRGTNNSEYAFWTGCLFPMIFRAQPCNFQRLNQKTALWILAKAPMQCGWSIYNWI